MLHSGVGEEYLEKWPVTFFGLMFGFLAYLVIQKRL